ncbi:MarR family winged helix-turn-helix transcriptional regulator [Occultella gossypii]|uniref:Winged helix DNA-binding protein n=1 Tax=Occultella gossypii TaxID=2800820 RepID=A0ABS7S884_9MICO|nr:MarR family transcriptional regulator [Occultella gossypii]MBZ2195834.1 winged helix DNA-binding protein [Occultella gossypii]
MNSADAVTPLQVGLLLHRAYAVATQDLNSALRPMDLSARHVATMFLIRDGTRTHRDLVQQLHTDKTGMVRVIDDLEELGFVSRTRSVEDRRVWLLSLTAAGTLGLQRAQEQTRGVAESLFGSLSRAELTALHDSLAHVLREVPDNQSGRRRD